MRKVHTSAAHRWGRAVALSTFTGSVNSSADGNSTLRQSRGYALAASGAFRLAVGTSSPSTTKNPRAGKARGFS
jgi:hypothetical protein